MDRIRGPSLVDAARSREPRLIERIGGVTSVHTISQVPIRRRSSMPYSQTAVFLLAKNLWALSTVAPTMVEMAWVLLRRRLWESANHRDNRPMLASFPFVPAERRC